MSKAGPTSDQQSRHGSGVDRFLNRTEDRVQATLRAGRTTIARKFGGRQRNFTGEVFWARGYFVSTVGLDEEVVRAYIRDQEHEDERLDQMKLVDCNN
jgi:REP element-mobilizing transposase RayT